MPGPNDLYNLAAEYLALCDAALATTDAGTITRKFVSPGSPAWDCPPQLTVHAGGPAVADTLPIGPTLQYGYRVDYPGNVNLVALTATVIRCTPVMDEDGDPPSATKLAASAAETLADVWAIWHELAARHRDGTAFVSPIGRKREMVIDPAASLLTQGGAAGWQLQIRVALDGYGVIS